MNNTTPKSLKPVTSSATQTTLDAVQAICEAVREVGQIPSGHLYAMVCGNLSLEQYQRVLEVAKRAGLIKETNNLLRWTGPEF